MDNIAPLSEGQPSLSFMDARSKDSGRRLLASYYAQQRNPVAFIDESFRGSERSSEFPFYLVSAVLVQPSALTKIRERYLAVVGSDFWHTTRAHKDREFESIERFTTEVDANSTSVSISLQLQLDPENLELARREAMLQLIDHLALSGCKLAVYEQRNTMSRNSSDASLVNKARKSGIGVGGIAVVGSITLIEAMMLGPYFVSWQFRQALTGRDFEGFTGFEEKAKIIDVSGLYFLNEKRPETAAARNSGPVSPAPHNEAKAIRSSISSMPNYQRQLQEILHMLPNFIAPPLPPWELRSWLKQTFPK